MRFCSRLVSLSSSASTLSDSRTWRTSSQAVPSTFAPFQISAARTITTAELRAAMDRIRQRIGTARSTRTTLARPDAIRLTDGPTELSVSAGSTTLPRAARCEPRRTRHSRRWTCMVQRSQSRCTLAAVTAAARSQHTTLRFRPAPSPHRRHVHDRDPRKAGAVHRQHVPLAVEVGLTMKRFNASTNRCYKATLTRVRYASMVCS